MFKRFEDTLSRLYCSMLRLNLDIHMLRVENVAVNSFFSSLSDSIDDDLLVDIKEQILQSPLVPQIHSPSSFCATFSNTDN
jgi:hypothetical protein